MRTRINLLGVKFGRLTVTEEGERNKRNSPTWNCVCECGKEVKGILAGTLRGGHTMSCGCLKRERVSARSFVDLEGQRFGRLVVTQYAGRNDKGQSLWTCDCDCGGFIHEMTTDRLKSGHTQSCGCLKNEVPIGNKYSVTHGRSRDREYGSFYNMHSRCRDEKNRSFYLYGGRGIKVCDRWSGPEGLANFLADMGPAPTRKHTIDRKNTNGDYEPVNCRWATIKEQNRNKRNSHIIEFRGERLNLEDWATRTGLKPSTIATRIDAGWSVEKALETPSRNNRVITFNGETRTLAEWAELVGLNRQTILGRLKAGWSFTEILATRPLRRPT